MNTPLRLWPGVLAVTLQWLLRYVVPIFAPEALIAGVIAGVLGGLAVIVWWAFFSRAPRAERWGGILLMIVAMLAFSRVLDKSIGTGMMGMMFPLFAIPTLSLTFVAWAVLTRGLPDRHRRVWMVVAVLLGAGGWTLLRTDGITGDAGAELRWRWTKTSEERLVAQAPKPEPSATPAPEPIPLPTPKATERPEPPTPPHAPPAAPAWPGFRGPARDGSVSAIRINTDWAAAPPVELWRRPIGPGWSSFAVNGDLIYTQEQRGDDELVVCYNAATGKPIWTHRDAVRFWESNGGAGPRATPTLSNGRVYTLGATGILNALNSTTGTVLWTRAAAADTGAKLPGWGFAGSPLVVDGNVIVATAGQMIAYDAATGARRWLGPASGEGYSSPHLLTLDGVPQIVLLSDQGVTSVAPADGTVLWKHAWPAGTRIVQPSIMPEGDLLIGADESLGLRRLAVTHTSAGWSTEERWTSRGLRPYFNDFVVHHGYAFGFDGSILACVDLSDGKRKWKGGRYGHGQLVLLRDQELLLVLSEEGELALVSASAGQFTELARVPAIDGKTWNHPVLVGDRLLIRNGTEMAAFRLPAAASTLPTR